MSRNIIPLSKECLLDPLKIKTARSWGHFPDCLNLRIFESLSRSYRRDFQMSVIPGTIISLTLWCLLFFAAFSNPFVQALYCHLPSPLR